MARIGEVPRLQETSSSGRARRPEGLCATASRAGSVYSRRRARARGASLNGRSARRKSRSRDVTWPSSTYRLRATLPQHRNGWSRSAGSAGRVDQDRGLPGLQTRILRRRARTGRRRAGRTRRATRLLHWYPSGRSYLLNGRAASNVRASAASPPSAPRTSDISPTSSNSTVVPSAWRYQRTLGHARLWAFQTTQRCRVRKRLYQQPVPTELHGEVPRVALGVPVVGANRDAGRPPKSVTPRASSDSSDGRSTALSASACLLARIKVRRRWRTCARRLSRCLGRWNGAREVGTLDRSRTHRAPSTLLPLLGLPQ